MVSHSWRVLWVLFSIAAGTLPVSAQESPAQAQLEVLLSVAPSLPNAARVSMMDEAAAIWRHHGVTINWLAATSVRSVAPPGLRVLVVERREGPGNRGEAFTVGELLRPVNGHPIAMMSIESAQRLVASVRGRAGYDLIVVDHRRLGVLLGRALAHEIGHFLLDTHTHASDGLMRPQFNALEFTDLRDEAFALDRTASEWLKSRPGPFAYAR